MNHTEHLLQVSIIVPVRNEESVLGRCLESLAAQKHPPGQKKAERGTQGLGDPNEKDPHNQNQVVWGTRVEDPSSHPFPEEGKGWGAQGLSDTERKDPPGQHTAEWGTPINWFEVIVVDDHSTDRTREIAESFPVRVIEADPLPEGWSGKCNACWSGAKVAKGKWLLFTDADTVHAPSSISQGILEAEESGAALLSYSPKQEVKGLAERALMPVIFAELAATYRPKEVCDPNSPVAAANGQYVLIRRDVYDAVGGHAAVSKAILEDVELARRVKQAGYKLQFRMSDVVTTRMYRNFGAMWEGWTKNLALLFPRPLRLAAMRMLEFVFLVMFFVAPIVSILFDDWMGLAINTSLLLVVLFFFLRRIRRAHFDCLSNTLAIFGLPLFVLLLVNSYISHKKGIAKWKGRVYAGNS